MKTTKFCIHNQWAPRTLKMQKQTAQNGKWGGGTQFVLIKDNKNEFDISTILEDMMNAKTRYVGPTGTWSSYL